MANEGRRDKILTRIWSSKFYTRGASRRSTRLRRAFSASFGVFFSILSSFEPLFSMCFKFFIVENSPKNCLKIGGSEEGSRTPQRTWRLDLSIGLRSKTPFIFRGQVKSRGATRGVFGTERKGLGQLVWTPLRSKTPFIFRCQGGSRDRTQRRLELGLLN